MSVAQLKSELQRLNPGQTAGRVIRVAPGYLVADGPLRAPGDLCRISDITGKDRGLAEVVSVESGSVSLVPVQARGSVRPGDRVELLAERSEIPVGDAFSGRLVDATGQMLDDAGPLDTIRVVSANRPAPKPLARASQLNALETGGKVIDALLPIARGQRIGIFAAAGVGKTTLVTQMARQTRCDH